MLKYLIGLLCLCFCFMVDKNGTNNFMFNLQHFDDLTYISNLFKVMTFSSLVHSSKQILNTIYNLLSRDRNFLNVSLPPQELLALHK